MSKHPRIGISGWSYPPWRRDFYPRGLAQKRELAFASRQVNSIEINGAFYALPKPSHFESWSRDVPDDFVFSIKANRFITHIKKLNAVEEPIRNFFASGVLSLGEKLGPILWQFPPQVHFDPAKFENFLAQLPHDVRAATKLARGHGPMLKGRAFIPGPRARNLRLRHAVEVRHASFENPGFIRLLRKHDAAIVTADTGGKWPYFEEPTSDFSYLRLHGPAELYVDGYDPESISKWADKVNAWSRTRQVYAYFDNDMKVQAPFNAVALLRQVIQGYEPAVPIADGPAGGDSPAGPRVAGNGSRWTTRAKTSKPRGRPAGTAKSRGKARRPPGPRSRKTRAGSTRTRP